MDLFRGWWGSPQYNHTVLAGPVTDRKYKRAQDLVNPPKSHPITYEPAARKPWTSELEAIKILNKSPHSNRADLGLAIPELQDWVYIPKQLIVKNVNVLEKLEEVEKRLVNIEKTNW